MKRLSHFDTEGSVRMVDVSAKPETRRTARAHAFVRIAPTVLKVLESAIANAKNSTTDVDVDNLVVSEAYVNEGPRQKRVRPAPMGRAYRYQRRMSHIVIKVTEKEA